MMNRTPKQLALRLCAGTLDRGFRLTVAERPKPFGPARVAIYLTADVGRFYKSLKARCAYDNSSSSALASIRSFVSKPSVNQL